MHGRGSIGLNCWIILEWPCHEITPLLKEMLSCVNKHTHASLGASQSPARGSFNIYSSIWLWCSFIGVKTLNLAAKLDTHGLFRGSLCAVFAQWRRIWRASRRHCLLLASVCRSCPFGLFKEAAFQNSRRTPGAAHLSRLFFFPALLHLWREGWTAHFLTLSCELFYFDSIFLVLI